MKNKMLTSFLMRDLMLCLRANYRLFVLKFSKSNVANHHSNGILYARSINNFNY